jgi:hypothetical protein
MMKKLTRNPLQQQFQMIVLTEMCKTKFKQCMNVSLNFSTATLAGYGIDHVA